MRAAWYIARNWPVTAIAAVVGVQSNTIRAWRRRLGRERIHRQAERARSAA